MVSEGPLELDCRLWKHGGSRDCLGYRRYAIRCIGSSFSSIRTPSAGEAGALFDKDDSTQLHELFNVARAVSIKGIGDQDSDDDVSFPEKLKDEKEKIFQKLNSPLTKGMERLQTMIYQTFCLIRGQKGMVECHIQWNRQRFKVGHPKTIWFCQWSLKVHSNSIAAFGNMVEREIGI
ncbi:hypothetical protein TNCT_8271 [Trichonephila clavata]|uniref:Uncharacterized protein n=1 Tax=Trichonephila clavata TaxID=2740835 RepID=A0A8X6GMK0_TRICU|nr:hypothetical protein TNCT_8271 [Trichonephila clavata]